MSWLPADSRLRSALLGSGRREAGAQPGAALGNYYFLSWRIKEAHSQGTWPWPFPNVKAWGKMALVDRLALFGKIKLLRTKHPPCRLGHNCIQQLEAAIR